jgi:hypothetical protein
MTADDTYNGYTNRETWALNLVLNNDQGLQEMTAERVADALANYTPWDWQTLNALDDQRAQYDAAGRANVAGDAVKELWEELTDPNEELMPLVAIISLLDEVGSAWRVDWYEIGQSWIDDLAEQED